MAHYNLIFQGKIIDGASLDEVKTNVARLFKADAAKTETLFSGKTIIIKKNLDSETTKKYLAILKKAGAIIQAVKTKETSDSTLDSTNTSDSQPADIPDSNIPQSKGLSAGLASFVDYNRSKPEEDEEGLQLAPIGSNILENLLHTEKVAVPDISHYTMAEAETGSLEEFAHKAETVELPDIENITMSDANTGSLEEFASRVEPVALPDISEINMAEQDDTPLSAQSSKENTIEIPDTSALSMSKAREGSLEGIEIKPEAVIIPDISHIEIEKTEDEKLNSTKAIFQIN